MSHTTQVADYLTARWQEEPQTPDIQAKREILALYRSQARSNDEFDCGHDECDYNCGEAVGIEYGLAMALEQLAQVYVHRSDFQPQWRHMKLA